MPVNEKRQLVLHIGDPKTGTSSIQRALQLGLVDGMCGKVSAFTTDNGSANAVSLARSFNRKGRTRVKTEMQPVMKWLSSTTTPYAVISSEFFSNADPSMVRRAFARRYPALTSNIKVIAYARPHVGRTLAAYSERVKCGYTLSDFDQWLPVFMKSAFIRYHLRFKKWRDEFGPGFVVRPFVPEELKGADAVTDFFASALDTQDFSVGSMMRENQTVTAKALAGLRHFNREAASADIPPGYRIPLARTIAKGIRTDPAAEKLEVDKASVALILQQFAEDARLLDAEFFGRPLFLPKLEAAERNAGERPIRLKIDDYFTPREQSLIAGHTASILELMPSSQEDWMLHYHENRARYNRGLPPDVDGGGEIQQRLQELMALFG